MKTGLRFLFAALVLSAPLAANAGVFVSVNIAPPPLLVYEQPPIPGDDYVWTPGYWAWDPDVEDYYWVPGTWVLAPEPGFYWTPGYWAWIDSYYVFHPGYWGPHVGYYGGINYGFGYYGHGYEGGYWRDNHFWYNRAVNNNVNVTNVYNTTVVNNYNDNHVAYNGGSGGVHERPTSDEQRWSNEHHIERTDLQERHRDEARHDRSQFASHGDQVIAATPRPGAFSEHSVVRTQAPSNWNRNPARNNGENRGETRPRIMDDQRNNDRGNDHPNDRGNFDRPRADDAPGRVIDRGNRDFPSRSSDLDRPMQQELPQTQRHRDRSTPTTTPESRPMPDVTPRDMSPRQRDPVERAPHYERMRPIPRDDQPQHEERPGRSERMQRMERPERPAPQREVMQQREGPQQHAMPQREIVQRPEARVERPAPQGHNPQRESRENREHGQPR